MSYRLPGPGLKQLLYRTFFSRLAQMLFKAFIVGCVLFLGVSLALYNYGLIGDWGIFADGRWLFNQWKHPWAGIVSVLWLGLGVFLFDTD